MGFTFAPAQTRMRIIRVEYMVPAKRIALLIFVLVGLCHYTLKRTHRKPVLDNTFTEHLPRLRAIRGEGRVHTRISPV